MVLVPPLPAWLYFVIPWKYEDKIIDKLLTFSSIFSVNILQW